MALTKIEKALLDTLAYAEGTLGVSNNGYDVVVTFKTIIGWTNDTKIIHGESDWLQVYNSAGKKSSAAGRYQFLGKTWRGGWVGGYEGKLGPNKPMTKDNQDTAALWLINNRLKQTYTGNEKITIPEITSQAKFDIFLQKCSPEWASLPVTKTVTTTNSKTGVKTVHKAGNGFYSGQGGSKTNTELYGVFTLALSKY
jgi:muramidase (phage lysozyme)